MAQEAWPTYWSLKPKPKQQNSVEGKFGSVRSSECSKVDKTSERQKVDESSERQIDESSKHQIDETPERRMNQTSKRQKRHFTSWIKSFITGSDRRTNRMEITNKNFAEKLPLIVDNDQPDIFKKREVPRLDRYLELK